MPFGAHFVLLSLTFLTSSGKLFVLPSVTVPFPQLSLKGLWKFTTNPEPDLARESIFKEKRNEEGRRKKEEKTGKTHKQHNTTWGRPLPSYRQANYQHARKGGFLESPGHVPKTHSSFMFTSPGKKTSSS